MRSKTHTPPDILNVLRVLATFFVFLLHGRQFIGGNDEYDKLIEYGDPLANLIIFFTKTPAWAGVWIFVFISSYLMGIAFITKRYDIFTDLSEETISIKKIFKFYIKRFLKLAPIYYLYFFAFEFFSNSAYFGKHPLETLRVLAFMYNDGGEIVGVGHLWYLSLAMQIYLIIPFIYLLFRKIGKGSRRTVNTYVRFYIIFLVFGLLVRLILSQYDLDWYTWVYSFIGSNLDLVICGILLAFVKCQGDHTVNSKRTYGIMINIQFIMLFVYNCYVYNSPIYEDMFIYQYVLPTLYIISCSLLIFRYHDPRHNYRADAVRDWKYPIRHFIDWFASYSFAFYVLHIRSFMYFSLTFGTMPAYLEKGLLWRYIFFYAATFLSTLFGAVILQYAVDGVTSGIKNAYRLMKT